MSQQEINKIIMTTWCLTSGEDWFVWIFRPTEETPESDIDILINIRKSISLFDLVQIYQDLEEKLGRKVDIVTERSIKNQRF